MTNNEICEAYFKALGWQKLNYCWEQPGPSGRLTSREDLERNICVDDSMNWMELPNILESFSAFREHVLERMGEDNYLMGMSEVIVGGYKHIYIKWYHSKLAGEFPVYKELIKDNHIPRAAVLAATAYWKGKK